MIDKQTNFDDFGVRRVLQAEAEARERIVAAEREAAEAVEEARAEARRIESDALERVHAFQAARAAEAEARIESMRRAAERKLAAIGEGTEGTNVQQTAEALARELIEVRDADAPPGGDDSE